MKKKSCKAAVLVLAGCMLFQLTAGISAYGAELQEEETEVTDSYETDEARQEPPELSETLPDNSENAEDEIDDTPENTGEEESISDLPDSVPETSVPETVQETGNNTPQNEGSSAESVSPEQSDIEPAAEDTVEREDVNQPAGASVSYEAHVQNIGWMNPVKDGAVGGTQGKKLQMEAFKIYLTSPEDETGNTVEGTILYRAHVQDYGWLGWTQNGRTAGTTGEKKRLEAVEIKLTGLLAETYDIYYRAHVSEYGTLGWAKNGETAGTMQISTPMESLEIILVKKGTPSAPVQDSPSCFTAENKGGITYSAHVKNLGWMDSVADGAVAGTQKRSLQMEALRIYLNNPKDASGAIIQGSIQYRAHVQDYGWREWSGNGQNAGTTGQSKRLEAIQIQLTGQMAEMYDIYYRTHVSSYGTLGWAKNGETAGTTQLSRAIESVEILLVEKGSSSAPVQDRLSCYTPTSKGTVTYSAHVERLGWMDSVADGAMAGTQGQNLQMEALKINLNNPMDENGNLIGGSIQYQAHVQDYGWRGWTENGGNAGTTGQKKRMEAVQIRLTGDMAQKYDIYYRTHVQNFGWLDWAKNGASSGTSGLAKQLEAIEIILVKKGSAAPGSVTTPYIDEAGLVSGMRISGKTDQILIVNAKGESTADVKLWEKQNGTWKCTRQMSGFVGSKGVGEPREGISRTPQGAYTLGFAFGIGGNPGTKLPYRQITQNSYWVGDSSSPYYNTWQEYPYRKSWKDEHLIDYRISYEFAITLDFDNGPGGGSAFFLHVSNGIPTAGCISVPRDQMLYLMRTIKKGAYIVNINDVAELRNY